MFKSYDRSSGVSLYGAVRWVINTSHTEREREKNETDWMNYDINRNPPPPHTHTAQDSDDLGSEEKKS